MTVIKGNKTYSYPTPNSAVASDTESLHLGSISASDTESLNNEPYTTNVSGHVRYLRPPPVRVSQVEDLLSLKKCSGKKKLRRYQNKCVLHTLNEEDENETGFIVMESYKSPFARLLEDADAMDYWNDFIEKTEEQQREIVKAFSERFDKNSNKVENCYKSSEEKQYGKISSKIKRTIKIKKNLSVETIKGYEDDLLDFLKANPLEVYTKVPPNSFDRLLLHAIAQYHGLKSLSVLTTICGNTKRSVEIYNNNKNWVPAECFLTDFIQELRK